jgi:pimeloyl-ACP methyl ester carboxylesterase
MARRIDVAGVTLALQDSGDGDPAVLFLHGLGGSANGWLAMLETCRERSWRGIAPDQRGAGRSESPPGPYSVGLWASDAVALLDALEVERAALVGHSVGCMISVAAAALLGERCWALALCGGSIAWPDGAEATFAERARLAREGRTDVVAEAVAATGLSQRCQQTDPRLVGLMREAIASNDGESYALWAEATAHGRMEALGQLDCPLLAFCGSEDPVTPPAAAEAIAAAAARGESARVEGAAHWCQIEDPDGTESTLFAFLERHRPGTGQAFG